MSLAAPPTPSTLDRALELRDQPLTPELARHILSLGFTEAETRRYDELTERVQRLPPMTAEQTAELQDFVTADDVLSTLKSRSRVLLGVRLKPR